MNGSGSGVVTTAASVLAALGFPGFVVWLIKHFGARYERVEILRKALDKGRVRENGYCGALDAFITGVDALPHPPPALVAARARALARMEEANRQLNGGA